MLARALLTVALAGFGVLVGASGLDRLSADKPSVARLVPAPFRAEAARTAAASALTGQQVQEAVQHARAAVSHDPVDTDATALFGSSLLLAGDDDGAAAAFRVAARFGWRNVATQLYWFDAAMQAGDYRVAADRMDAVLRTHPGFEEREAMFRALESEPAARAVLLDHLAGRPIWLGKYLFVDETTPPDVIANRVTTLTALGAAKHPLGCHSMVTITRKLMQLHERAQAVRVWNANCPTQQVGQGIVDPGFAEIDSAQASPFGWIVRRSGDVSVEVAGDGGKRRLVLGNHAANARLVLDQPVDLAPGRYVMRAAIDPASARAADRLSATIGCGDPPFPVSGDGRLSAEGVVLEVPSCATLRLGIWLQPGTETVALNSVSLTKAAGR